MVSIQEETLLAYVDGELPPDEAAEVAAVLERDPAAAALAEQFREASRLLAAAYDQPMREPVPQRLIDAVEGSRPAGDATVLPWTPRRQRTPAARRYALPLAASVALAVGLAGGFGLSGLWPPGPGAAPAITAAGLTATATFQQALETAASGVPVIWESTGGAVAEVMPLLTFHEGDGRDGDGRYCREYQTTVAGAAATDVAFGIACRQEGGGWRSRLVVAGPAVDPGTPDSAFVPATGEAPGADFRAFVDALVGDSVVAPDTERRLLSSGWARPE